MFNLIGFRTYLFATTFPGQFGVPATNSNHVTNHNPHKGYIGTEQLQMAASFKWTPGVDNALFINCHHIAARRSSQDRRPSHILLHYNLIKTPPLVL